MLRFHRWIVLAAIVCVSIFLGLSGLLRPLGDLVRAATLPVVRLAAHAATAIFPAKQGASVAALEEQNKQLEARLATLAVDDAKLQALEEENRVLRTQAKFLATSGYDSVGARVISREVQNQRSLLLIDRGQNDHIEIGQAAITGDGVFIGKILQIKEQVAVVELVSDPQSRVSAALANENRVIGVVEGRGNGAALLRYVPASANLKRDQLLVTAGSEEKVPPHLPFGIINIVQGKPTDPFLSASIEPLVPLEQITFVSVLRPSALRPSL